MKLRYLLGKLKTAAPLLIYLLIYIVAFIKLESINAGQYDLTSSKLDMEIPFISQFVFAYLSWFILVPGVMTYLLFFDEDTFRYGSAMLICGMTLFLIISAAFPTALNIRPTHLPNTISGRICEWLYKTDTPTNVFPSVHVYNTAVILASVYRTKDERLKKPTVFTSLMIWGILIVCSTIFIKQHSLLDVLYGFVMCAAFNWVYSLLEKKGKIPVRNTRSEYDQLY